MSAPSLTVSRQGLGVVPADLLNTYEQTADNLAQLRAFIGAPGVQVFMRGYVSLNDGGQGPFSWVSNATGPDDGQNIIIPNGVTVGAWVRINLFPQLYTGVKLTWVGAQVSAATWLGGDAAEIPYVIPQNLTGSQGIPPKTLATASYVVNINHNGVTVATATSNTTDGEWAFACAADVAVVPGDAVEFIGPGDTTVANFALTILVRLT